LPSASADHTTTLIAETGKNAPAPWVPFTRAGCDFGAIALADMELENTNADIITVFGAGSPQAIAAKNNSTQATADFEGIAIHCAQNSRLCVPQNGGVADAPPDEPGGYSGFNGLFGHKYVVPAIAGGATSLTDLLGNPIPGFPGFDGMFPAVTLSYAASMLEAGIPRSLVTFPMRTIITSRRALTAQERPAMYNSSSTTTPVSQHSSLA